MSSDGMPIVRRQAITLLGGVGVAVIAVACGSDSNESATVSSTTAGGSVRFG